MKRRVLTIFSSLSKSQLGSQSLRRVATYLSFLPLVGGFLALTTGCAHHKTNSLKNYDQEKGKVFDLESQDSIHAWSADDKEVLQARRDFILAQRAEMLGDYETSIEIWRKILAEHGYSETVGQRYAVALLKLGQFDEAEKILEKIYQKAGQETRVNAGVLLAHLKNSKEELPEVIQIYRNILKERPYHADACLNLAELYFENKRDKEAKKVLENCDRRFLSRFQKKSIKANGEFQFRIGRHYLDMGDLKSAQRRFEKALKSDPSHTKSILALGILFQETKRPELAIERWKSFLNKNPDDQIILNQLVQYWILKKRLDKAKPYLESLVDVDDSNYEMKLRLGYLYLEQKKYSRAENVLMEVVDAGAGIDRAYYYLFLVKQREGKVREALQYAIRIDSSSMLYKEMTLYIIGVFREEIRRLKAMKGEVNKLAAGVLGDEFDSLLNDRIAREMDDSLAPDRGIDELAGTSAPRFGNNLFDSVNGSNNQSEQVPSDFEFDLRMGRVDWNESRQRYSKAIDELKELVGHKKFSDQHYFYWASLEERRSQTEAADKIIKNLLERSPDNAQAWNYLGYSLLERHQKSLELGELDESRIKEIESYLAKAIELGPDDGHIQDSWGWLQVMLGNYDLGIQFLKKAQTKLKEDPTVRMHLGLAYKKAGRFKRALVVFNEMLSLDLKDKDRATVERIIKTIRSKNNELADQELADNGESQSPAKPKKDQPQTVETSQKKRDPASK